MSDQARNWWEEPLPATVPGTATPHGEAFTPPQAPPFEQLPEPSQPTRPDEPPRTDPEAMELRDRVVEALKNVYDPELGMNIVDLGLVYGVDVYSDRVYITYTLTTIACPIGPLIEMEMQRFLADVPGIELVEAEMVFRPPWTPDMMSEEAKAALGFF